MTLGEQGLVDKLKHAAGNLIHHFFETDGSTYPNFSEYYPGTIINFTRVKIGMNIPRENVMKRDSRNDFNLEKMVDHVFASPSSRALARWDGWPVAIMLDWPV